MLVLIFQLLALWFDHPILFADTFRQGESFISMEFIRKFLQVPRLRCEDEGKVFNAHTVELTTPDGEVKQFSG
jgi:hypothetical protein